MTELDNAYLEQALTGLCRHAHLLPEHLHSPYNRAISRFSDRIKQQDGLRTSALYSSLSAILQTSVRAVRVYPVTEFPAQAALLADVQVLPAFHLESDTFAPASSPETALLARFDDRFRPNATAVTTALSAVTFALRLARTLDSAEASYTAFVMDQHEFYQRPLVVRTTIDSNQPIATEVRPSGLLCTSMPSFYSWHFRSFGPGGGELLRSPTF